MNFKKLLLWSVFDLICKTHCALEKMTFIYFPGILSDDFASVLNQMPPVTEIARMSKLWHLLLQIHNSHIHFVVVKHSGISLSALMKRFLRGLEQQVHPYEASLERHCPICLTHLSCNLFC